jgi:hypothetical protein
MYLRLKPMKGAGARLLVAKTPMLKGVTVPGVKFV